MRSCARTTSPALGRPSSANLSCSVRSSGAFASASVIAFANSSSVDVRRVLWNRKKNTNTNKLIKKWERVSVGMDLMVVLLVLLLFLLEFRQTSATFFEHRKKKQRVCVSVEIFFFSYISHGRKTKWDLKFTCCK